MFIYNTDGRELICLMWEFSYMPYLPLYTLSILAFSEGFSKRLCSVQVSEFVFEEVRQLLKTALELRRKYMDLSLQGFCHTTANMLDKKLPPSSAFCVPDTLGWAKFTAAGDIMASESTP